MRHQQRQMRHLPITGYGSFLWKDIMRVSLRIEQTLMQTFMPYSCFRLSAQALDNKRLGKQRVEAWQILQALQGKTKGWVNHPATIMWQGCEQSLIQYGLIVCEEWRNRGFEDNMTDRFKAELREGSFKQPWWITFDPLNTSHQSNLYRKDPVYYAEFSIVGASLPYVWCKPDGSYKLGEIPSEV